MEGSKDKLEREKKTSPTEIVQLRRQTVEQICLNEERFAALLSHNPSLLFLKDEEGKYVYLNPAYEKQYALTPDWHGKTDFDFWPQESAELFRQNDAKVLVSGDICQFLEDSFDLNGKRHCWLCYKFPFTDSQGRRYVGGIGIDSTPRIMAEEALRESESKLAEANRQKQEILESISDCFYALDKDLRFTYVNRAAEEIWSLSRADLIGRKIEDVFPGIISISLSKFHQVLEERIPQHYEVYSKVIQRWGDMSVYPAQNGICVYFHDITGRKQAEENLRRAKDELETRVQERTRELEVRASQLRALAGELTLAEQRERQHLANLLHDGLQQILVGAKYRVNSAARSQDVKSELNQVSDLIDDAIETSRSLTSELSPTVLIQGNLISALEWLARWMQSKYDLDVSLTARRKIDVLPQDVILLLFQAVRELLFNVVKHAGVKSARVIVNQLDGRILITVEDEGVGFLPKRLRAKGGEVGGIGLFSLSERFSHMGGRLRIESAPGRGSRFKLGIPYSSANAATETDEGKRHVSVVMSSSSESKLASENNTRIVLVDDHLVMRQGLAGLLRLEQGFEIVGEASDGAAAIELVKELKPDVVLMDINMPGMDGIEATRILHQKYPEIRIIGLSMFDANEKAAAMFEAGAVDYVTKNGPAEKLITAVRTAVGRSEKL